LDAIDAAIAAKRYFQEIKNITKFIIETSLQKEMLMIGW
jgi:hypothetical protein